MKKTFDKIGLIFLLAFIVYLPFAELLSSFLEWHTGLSPNLIYWLAHWHWFAAVLFFVPAIVSMLLGKRKLSKSQILALLLLALGVLSIFFLSPSISRGIEGFRLTLFGLVFFLFASEINLSDKWRKNIIATYLFIAMFMALWALLERFFPLKYWGVLGVINPDLMFGYGWHGAGSLMQSASFLGGPNQLGSYLLPAFFLAVVSIKYQILSNAISNNLGKISNTIFKRKTTNKLRPIFYFILSTLYLITILLASSRSAIVGLAVGIALLAWTQKKLVLRVGAFSGLGISVIFVLWLLAAHPHLGDIITHGASQSGHAESLKITNQEIQARLHEPIKLIFGAGVGTAGPIAIKYGGIISESWYLQIILELGIVGLALFLAFFYYLGQELWHKGERGLFFGFIAVLVAALFLHTLSDNPALTYTIFILIGLSLTKENDV